MNMHSILIGSLLLSILHAFIPSHWLPLLAIARKEQWTMGTTLRVAFLAGLAHAGSTILLGMALGLAGRGLAEGIEGFTRWVTPSILLGMGITYLIRHHRHPHFQLPAAPLPAKSKGRIIGTLLLAMFFAPCFEIEAYFLAAGAIGWGMLLKVAAIYLIVTLVGMLLWVRVAFTGLQQLNWHALDHKAGIITGGTLIVTGLISFFIT